jgi:sec-independent protein translocase protein TatA
MFQGFTGWHALILLVIIILLFGATKLPGLAKSVGQSMKIFKNEVKSEDAAKPVDGPQLNQTPPEAQQQTTDATKSDSKP